MILSVITYLLHDDLTSWTDYINSDYASMFGSKMFLVFIKMYKLLLQGCVYKDAFTRIIGPTYDVIVCQLIVNK